MSRDIILRTHGGLGNQLFQILYGRLFSECMGASLKEIHDLRYPHAFSRSGLLVRGEKPTPWQAFVSAARIPKVLHRTVARIEKPLSLGRSFYLDGYFQGVEFYKPFTAKALTRHLEILANELSIGSANLDVCLVHLRVGDFFADVATAKMHIIERLKNTPTGSHVITNDESLLDDPDIAPFIELRALKLVTTVGMPAEEVLRNMARYRRLEANDSTLTFWSSVLGGSELSIKDKTLRDCHDFLKKHRQSNCMAER